jgi:hypothetical protein
VGIGETLLFACLLIGMLTLAAGVTDPRHRRRHHRRRVHR